MFVFSGILYIPIARIADKFFGPPVPWRLSGGIVLALGTAALSSDPMWSVPSAIALQLPGLSLVLVLAGIYRRGREMRLAETDQDSDWMARYAAILEADRASVRSTAVLPKKKSELDKLLLAAIAGSPPGDHQQALRGAYIQLANFQDLSEQQIDAVTKYDAIITHGSDGKTRDSGDADDVTQLAKVMGDSLEIVLPLMNVVAAETENRVAILSKV
tara:strand:+ start:2389 stop:3036 length:648 start_codon:yes stop_codon:yes gene_type:complete